MSDWLAAIILGLVEGLTEFIPVSSTGHVLLAGHFLGFDSPGRAFEVLIQLGAILAILGVYAGRLWRIFSTAPRDPRARRFILSVLVAFLPAVVVGVIAHDFIKTVLFETPALIAVMLILGGIVLLFVDRLATAPRYAEAEDLPAHGEAVPDGAREHRDAVEAAAGRNEAGGAQRPGVGLMPTRLLKAAGTRPEPPVSLPREKETMSRATATAEPELEPPGI